MAATDTNKYQEANTAISDFDGAYEGNVTLSFTTSTGFNIGSLFTQFMFFIFPAIPTNSAGKTVVLPGGIARPFIIKNNTGGPLTFMVGTGALEVTISDNNAHMLYTDGINSVYQVT